MYFRRLKDLREDHDFTQAYVANYLKMQRSVYRRYETGEREIPTWAVIRLTSLYGCTADYLLGLSEQPHA